MHPSVIHPHKESSIPQGEEGMTMVVHVRVARATYLIVIRPSVKNAPFHGGESMIMVVRVSYCRWYVSCESPHGMFLVCVLLWYQPFGPPIC